MSKPLTYSWVLRDAAAWHQQFADVGSSSVRQHMGSRARHLRSLADILDQITPEILTHAADCVEFAYERGYHEHGYPLPAELRRFAAKIVEPLKETEWPSR